MLRRGIHASSGAGGGGGGCSTTGRPFLRLAGHALPARRTAGTTRRLFANAGGPPPPPSSGGGGGTAFGVLVGAAVGASAWTGYRYYTDPPFRSRLNDLWASLSASSTSTTSKSAAEALPNNTNNNTNNNTTTTTTNSEHAASVAESVTGSVGAEPLEAGSAPAHDAHEEAVVALPDSFVMASHVVEEPQGDRKEEAEEEEEEEDDAGGKVQPPAVGGPAAEQAADLDDALLVITPQPLTGGHGDDAAGEAEGAVEQRPIPDVVAVPVLAAVSPEEEKAGASVETPSAKSAAVPAAVVAMVTESFAASDAHQEAVAAASNSVGDDSHMAEQLQEPATPTETAAQHSPKEEHHSSDSVIRLQELQAIKEIITIQAEGCERQVREKVARLRSKYEQKMAALHQQVAEVVAEQVDIERQRMVDEFQSRLNQQLDDLQRQFVDERQHLYAEMEDIVAGLNARFVELVREEKQLLNQQLEESAQLHAQTLAYLETLVEEVEYRNRHLSEERQWWHWTEQLTSAVRALESAALGPEGHLLPFQAELDLVRSLAITRPLYKAVAQHIEAQAPRGVYSVGRLRERFDQVEKHVRVAALVPEGGGLLRHAVAPLLAATVSLNPYHAPTEQELLLDSARRHLQEDDLLTALHDMEQLTGLAHELAHDWIEEARKRLIVEQAISVISADLATLKPPTA